ncbi:MAG TPA: HEAT repeat domain-containing protein, partial [Terriglobales bacterium]|nr:HEAT repeat domain-containing protein [Terriglobales bacterium]
PDTNPAMRSMAIMHLAKHQAPDSKEIARLVVPQESLEIRLVAIGALMQLGCPSECMREILHYQERLFYGENTSEQIFDKQPISEEAKQSLQANSIKLNQQIRLLLQKNEKSTIDVLVRVYGLGGLQPAKFAVQMTQQMPPPSVCVLLQQSANDRNSILGKPSDDFSLFLNSVINKHCTGENHG